MPTVVQTKYSAGGVTSFDSPIVVGRRLLLWQSGRDTPTAGNIAHLASLGWTHLASCTNATGFERGGAFYWKSAAATNESWNLTAPDLEYILVETDATVETPVVASIADTAASSANMDCGGSFTPAEGDDFLAIGGASVGASDNDYDSLPNPITPYANVDEGPEPGGVWNSFSPLMWVGWLSDSSASGSYVVGGTNARPRTYCGITILLASSPPPAEITPPFICILDDEDLSELACINVEDLEDWKIKLELQGTGSGTFTVHRSTAIATDSILKMGNWIAVTIPQIQEDPIFLVQIETIVTTLISEDEEGGEVVVFGGRGPLSYLERVKAYPRSFEGGGSDALSTNGGYLHGPASTGNKAGQILNRSIEEWQSTDRGVADVGRRLQPIKHLTRDFDYTDDSSSAAWATTAMTAELSQGYVGETGLQGVLELIGTGEIDILMWPDLSMQAFNSYGRDLTATDFAADKVIFRRAFNINEALKRSFGPGVVPTDTIVQGEESTWGFASSPMAGSVPDVEGYLSAPGTDTAALEEIGLADMRRRLRQGESVQFQIDVPMFGDEPNPEFGVYLFGPPGSNGQFYLGDTVTLDTGNGFHDFDNDDVRVMAATITHDDAGDLVIIPELKGTKILGRFGATTGTPGGVGIGASAGGTGGGTPAPPTGNIVGTQALSAVNGHIADTVDAHVASAVEVDGSGFTELDTGIDDLQEFAEAVDAALASGGGGGGGGVLRDLERTRRTSGNITLTNDGSWTDVDTGLDLVINAVAGDWLGINVSAFFGSENINTGLDAATIVAGSPVNYVSGSAGGASAFGVQAWLAADGSQAMPVGGEVLYQVVSGDISGGTVTLRLRYRKVSGVDRTLSANTNQPLEFSVKNYGQSAAQIVTALGAWVGVASAATAGGSTVLADRIYTSRIYVPYPITPTHMGVGIQTSAGSLDLGIYSDDGTGQSPGTLLMSTGNFASPGTGRRTRAITSPVTIGPGVYWFAMVASSATLSAQYTWTGTGNGGGGPMKCMVGSAAVGTAGTLPSTPTAFNANSWAQAVWAEIQ